jgi:CO dehydrogenase/acetyl-CoA synthase delta subunit
LFLQPKFVTILLHFSFEEAFMALVIPKESYSGKIYEVQLGSGAKGVTIGGASALPFLSFEGVFPHKPAVALEIMDIAPSDWPETVQKAVGGASANPVSWAKFCQEQGADAVALRLVGTHPDQQNKSPEEAAKIAAELAPRAARTVRSARRWRRTIRPWLPRPWPTTTSSLP